MTATRRAARSLSLAGILALLACAPDGPSEGGDPSPSLAVPRVDLEQLDEAARRDLEAQLAITDERAAAGPRALAGAIGELGRLYHAHGLEEEAAACYREAERIDPADRRWPYYLGFLHQRRGDPQAAAASFERALASSPDDPATRLRLAQARFEAGQLEGAAENFRYVLERHPAAAAAAQAGLARIAAASGDPAAAIRLFEEALRLQPEATQLHGPLAEAYRAAGQDDLAQRNLELRGTTPVAFEDPLIEALDRKAAGAEPHLARAAAAASDGRPREAMAEYRRALAADPVDATAHRELGLLLAAAGELEEARAELDEALLLEPQNPSHMAALARVLADAGEDEGAIDLLTQAAELAPERVATLRELGAALARVGRFGEATVAYSRALAIEPASAVSRLGRAESLLAAGRPATAVADLEAVLAAEPDNARARLRLGEAWQQVGNQEAALEQFELAAAATALAPPARAAALAGAGAVLAAIGRPAAGAERYRRALELEPALDGAELGLAGVLAAMGRDDEAIAALDRLLQRRPDAAARIARGPALLRAGRAREGLADFAAAAELDPAAEAARLGQAAALAQLGRWDEARQTLEAAVAQRPDSLPPVHALSRLLASSPDRTVRDGERALELAFRAVASEQSPTHAETVAMALAESGRFDEAAQWQREVLAGALASGAPPARLAELRANLAAYEAASPCCAGQPQRPPAP